MTQHTVQLIAGTGLLVLAIAAPYQPMLTRVGFVVLAVSVYADVRWLMFAGLLVVLASAFHGLWRGRMLQKREVSEPLRQPVSNPIDASISASEGGDAAHRSM